ncbi:hypothetical protein EZV62_021444 [Acer yangbiense]|uniref:NAC domain-containing protein n=1 Tax=Acer yangbiense TaxID=1000413 RepID=A0A5C7H6P2_9ROSI|nr:hypothetical protein EZV62_021444 [Acer yangbiense]
MYPSAASPPPDISFTCTPEELCVSLERMMSGFPLPSNVITDINPYIYEPSNLPDGVWYFVRSKQNTNTQHGYWKAKGDAVEVFSNSFIIGWRTSHEFYEGQVCHEHKTDWVMQEFRITRKRVGESSKSEDSSSLCRVLLSAEQTPNSENQQSMSTVDTSQDSSSKPQVKDDDDVSERPANNHVPYLPDSDYISRGDFLELLDLLDEPASPSSSSETSSCVTMSSDDCFDADAWLKELESNNNQDQVQDNAGYRYTAPASHRPTEMVVFPVITETLVSIETFVFLSICLLNEKEDILIFSLSTATGSLISVENRNSPIREIHETDSSGIARGLVDQANSGQEANYRDAAGPSTSSHSRNVASSSNSNSAAVQNGEEKTVGRVDKLKKYILCFKQF